MALESLPKIAPALFSAEQDLIQIYNKKSDTVGTINASYIGGSTPPSGVSGAIQFSNGSAFASDAANLFWDDTNKRLGVGTNAPLSNLQVNNPTGGTTKISLSGIGSVKSELSLNYGSGECRWHNYGGGYFPTIYSNNSEALRIDNSQNVGIGTTAPTARTHIKGSGSTSATTSLLVEDSAGTNWLQVKDNGDITNGANGSNQLQLLYSPTSQFFRLRNQGINVDFYAGNNGNALIEVGGGTVPFNVIAGSANLNLSNGGVRVGSSYDTTNACAQLEVVSTTKGFLPPRMSTAQKNAIGTPAAGLVVFDTDLNKLCVRGASAWETITSV